MFALRKSRPSRRAVTLLELLLALSLLVVIASLAWPLLSRSFDNQRLILAAEQLRNDLLQTRVKAINNGVAYRLRYQPEATSYTIEAHQAGVALDAQTAPLGSMAGQSQMSQTGDLDQRDLVARTRELPAGVRFLGVELAFDSRAEEIMSGVSESEQRPRYGELPDQMLFCYPDGTTSTARLALGNERDRAVVIELRGLTGVATLGEVRLIEELMQ